MIISNEVKSILISALLDSTLETGIWKGGNLITLFSIPSDLVDC